MFDKTLEKRVDRSISYQQQGNESTIVSNEANKRYVDQTQNFKFCDKTFVSAAVSSC